MKILSMVIPNDNINKLTPFLDSIVGRFSSNDSFEVCVAHGTNISIDDIQNTQKKYPFKIKFSQTKWGYQEGNTNHNHLIFNISDQQTYFILCMTDRWHLKGNNIDLELQKYIGMVPDHKFFLHPIQRVKPPRSMMIGYRENDNNVIMTRAFVYAINGIPEWGRFHDATIGMLHYFIYHLRKDTHIRAISIPDILNIQVMTGSGFNTRSIQTYVYRKHYFTSAKMMKYLYNKSKAFGKRKKIRLPFWALSIREKMIIFKKGYDNFDMYEMLKLYPLLANKDGGGYKLLCKINKKPKNIFYRILGKIIKYIFRVRTVYIKHILDDDIMKIWQSPEARQVIKEKKYCNPETEDFLENKPGKLLNGKKYPA